MRNNEPIPTLIWADLETTGLDRDRDEILEIAAVATDVRLEPIAAPADRFEAVLRWRGDPLTMEDVVRKMHSKNGLLQEASLSRLSVESTDVRFAAWLDTVTEATDAERLTLAGAGIAFDRFWIERHMPLSASKLHYRVFDASTLRQTLLWDWAGDARPPEGGVHHRAMSDAKNALATARYTMSVMASASPPEADGSGFEPPQSVR